MIRFAFVAGFFMFNKFFYNEMKTKIISALRTKYQRFGLSNEAVDRIASALEKTVTDESGIDAALAEASTMTLIAEELQKSADAERRNRSTLQKSFDDYKKAHPSDEPDPVVKTEPSGNDAILAMLKQMQDDNKALKARLDERDANARTDEMRAKVLAGLKASGREDSAVTNIIMRQFAVGKDDTADSLIEKYKGSYDADYKMIHGDGAVPPVGNFFPKSDKPDANEFAGAVERLRVKGVLPAKKQ